LYELKIGVVGSKLAGELPILHVKHLIAEKTNACTAHSVAYNKIKLNPVYKYVALLIQSAIFSPDAERK